MLSSNYLFVIVIGNVWIFGPICIFSVIFIVIVIGNV